MRTKQEHSPAREKLFEAAQTLILEKGFAGTTVDDICKASKLTKGSFFHYFKSKENLGVRLLEKYCASSKEMFACGCCQEEKDPLKRIYGFLDYMIGMSKKGGGKGCLLGSMAQELSDTHPEIRSICCRGFSEIAAHLESDLKAAKAKYAPKASFDPKSLAEHFVTVLEGSMLVSKVRKGTENKISGVEHYKNYLKALFGR